jgi:protein HIRA/HIR1
MNMQQAQSADRKIWEITVGSPISSFSICSKYVLIGAMDGTVRFLHIKDAQLVVPILNQASPIFHTAFSPNSIYGGVLTENAKLSVWNMNTIKVHVKSKCDDILNGTGYINLFYVSDLGIPFVGTSTGSSYSYSVDLESWMLVNANDALTRTGLHGSIANIKNMKTYPVATLQYISHTFQQKVKVPTELSDDSWEAQSKLSFIEHQIKLCEKVNSPHELKHWYSTFGYYLATHGTEKKVRQVLDDLLGPIYSLQNDEACKEKHKILGVSKHDLLQEVLTHFRTSTKWQRIYIEYFDQLSSVSKKSTEMETN